jgi:hypothetical protein
MSDISSFAEWEAQHQHSDEGEPALSERQQKLIDMASENRVWVGRDSSNDFRSSASESEDMDNGGPELPVRKKMIGSRTVNGELREDEHLTWNANLRLGRTGSWQISSSAVEESQELPRRLEEVIVSPAGLLAQHRRG